MITTRFTVSSFKENKIKEAKKALDVLKKGIQIRKLKENDINKSAIGDEKIDEYIKQHNFLLIDVENIPKKIDEFIKNEYRSWKTFFDVLQALSDRWKNAEHDDFFIKKIWGSDYPCIHLEGDSILHEFNLEYEEICRNIFVITLSQCEDHHPFTYIVDTNELMFYSCLNEKPVDVKNLIEVSIKIGVDEFIQRCRKKEMKWLKQTQKIRKRAKKLYGKTNRK